MHPAHCTPTPPVRRPHHIARVLLVLTLALAWLGPLVAQARADGDPASDVLAVQSVFFTPGARVGTAQAGQLTRLVAEAAKRGFPVRVAIISGPADLGAIPALWRKPATYAQFLGQELSLTFNGTLLVVMPNGYGVHQFAAGFTTHEPSLTGLPVPGTALGAAAIQGVMKLAADAGHPLAAVSSTTAAASSGSASPLPWIALVIGALIVAAAWTASLRRRPLRRAG